MKALYVGLRTKCLLLLFTAFYFFAGTETGFSGRGEEKFHNSLSKSNLKNRKILNVTDDKLGKESWSTIDHTNYAKGIVVFEIDRDIPFVLKDKFSCTIDLLVTTYDAKNISHKSIEHLAINYDPEKNSVYNNRSVLYFKNIHRISAEVMNISYRQSNGATLTPDIFSLTGEIFVSRT
jgi:hypothetical protein